MVHLIVLPALEVGDVLMTHTLTPWCCHRCASSSWVAVHHIWRGALPPAPFLSLQRFWEVAVRVVQGIRGGIDGGICLHEEGPSHVPGLALDPVPDQPSVTICALLGGLHFGGSPDVRCTCNLMVLLQLACCYQ